MDTIQLKNNHSLRIVLERLSKQLHVWWDDKNFKPGNSFFERVKWWGWKTDQVVKQMIDPTKITDAMLYRNQPFAGLDFSGLTFENVSFYGSHFYKANMHNTIFKNCDFTGVDFWLDTDFTTTQFIDCKGVNTEQLRII